MKTTKLQTLTQLSIEGTSYLWMKADWVLGSGLQKDTVMKPNDSPSYPNLKWSVPIYPCNNVQHKGKHGDYLGKYWTLAMADCNLYIPSYSLIPIYFKFYIKTLIPIKKRKRNNQLCQILLSQIQWEIRTDSILWRSLVILRTVYQCGGGKDLTGAGVLRREWKRGRTAQEDNQHLSNSAAKGKKEIWQ